MQRLACQILSLKTGVRVPVGMPIEGVSMSSESYARDVASRLMGVIPIRCVDSATRGYSFVMTCPLCDKERLLTSAERDARRTYCCGRTHVLSPYDKSRGVEYPQTVKNMVRVQGVAGRDRVREWK